MHSPGADESDGEAACPWRAELRSTRALAWPLILANLTFALIQVLRGLHDTHMPMIFAFIGYWVIGLGGVWLAFAAGRKRAAIWTGFALGLGRSLPC